MEAVPEATDTAAVDPAAIDPAALLAESEWIGALAAGLLGDASRAEDLAQDVRLAALRRPPAGGVFTRPWLVTVARNAARMLHRSESARTARETDRARGDADRQASSPSELLAQLETQELVSRLVRDLPAELADVVLLSFFEGHSSEQIARLRGIPAGTVRWRKRRALELLRERLDTHFDGDRHAWLSALAPLAAPGWRSGANAAAGGGLLAGFLAPWIAMSLPLKLISLTVACALLALPFFPWESRAPVIETASGDAARAEDDLAVVPLVLEDLAPVTPDASAERIVVDQPQAATNTAADAPTTRVRLRVVDAHGEPVAAAQVKLSLSFALQAAHETLLADLGPLRLAGLQAEFTRETRADGLAEWETDLLREGGTVEFLVSGPRFGTGSLTALLEVGSDVDLGDVTLASGGAVEGVVRGAAGEPLARVIVALGPAELRADGSAPESPDTFGLLDWDLGTARTNARGEYHMDGIEPGDYRAYAKTHMDGEVSWSEGLTVQPDGLTANNDLRCESRALGPARILVLGADGEPLPTGQTLLRVKGHALMGRVNGEGVKVFRSWGRFAGGSLEVSDTSFIHRSTVIERLPHSTDPLVVQLERATVSEQLVSLVGPEGDPIESASVKVTALGRNRTWEVVAGEVSVVLPAEEGDRFNLFVEARGYRLLALKKLSVSDVQTPWSLTLEELPVIRGRVMAEGKPVVGAKLGLYRRLKAGFVSVKGDDVRLVAGGAIDEATSGGDGSFELYTAKEGALVVTAAARGRADAVVELGGAAGERSGVAIEMKSFGSLSGVVHDPMGQAVPRAKLVLNHPYRKRLRTRARKDGSYRFRRVPEGDWVLRVVAEFDDGFFASGVRVAEGFVFPVNCAVLAGRETVRDLRVAEPVMTTVRGRLTVGGVDAGSFTVEASSLGEDPFAVSWEVSTPLAAGEVFELSVPAGESLRLALSTTRLRGAVWREIEAAALPLELDVNLELATLQVRAPSGHAVGDGGVSPVQVEWRSGGWTMTLSLTPDAEGQFAPVIVPAGDLTLTWKEPQAEDVSSLDVQLHGDDEREIVLR